MAARLAALGSSLGSGASPRNAGLSDVLGALSASSEEEEDTGSLHSTEPVIEQRAQPSPAATRVGATMPAAAEDEPEVEEKPEQVRMPRRVLVLPGLVSASIQTPARSRETEM